MVRLQPRYAGRAVLQLHIHSWSQLRIPHHRPFPQLRLCHNLFIAVQESLVAKGNRNLLQGMSGSLDVVKPRETRGEQAEPGDDEVEVAVDSGERVRGDHTDNEVEDPVGGCCQSHALASGAKGKDFGREKPERSTVSVCHSFVGNVYSYQGIGPQVKPYVML